MFKILLSATLCAVLSIHTLNAQEESFKIAIDRDFSPFTYALQDPDLGTDAFGGLHYEIIVGSLNEAGIKHEVQAYPWKRIIVLTDRSKIDASVPWRYKKERFEKYNMVGPITLSGSHTVIWAKKGFVDRNWTSLEDLEGYTIGTIAGYAYPKPFEDATFLSKHVVTAGHDTLLKLLDSNRIDLVIGDENVLFAEAVNMGIQDSFIVTGKPLDTVKRYFAVPKEKKAKAKIIQKALEAFHDTEEYTRIIRRYSKAFDE